MTPYPRFAERLRAAVVTHGRRERTQLPQQSTLDASGDRGEQFAQRLRRALPPQRRRPPVTTFTEL